MNRIKEIREEKKISQNQLARIAGISQPYLCDLERNRRWAKPETFQKIADALNVPVSSLLREAI